MKSVNIYILMVATVFFASCNNGERGSAKQTKQEQVIKNSVYCKFSNRVAYQCTQSEPSCPADNTKIICNGYSFLGGYSDRGRDTVTRSINNWKSGSFWGLIQYDAIIAHVKSTSNGYSIISDTDRQPTRSFKLYGSIGDVAYVIMDLDRYDQNFMVDDLYASVKRTITESEYNEIKDIIEFKRSIIATKDLIARGRTAQKPPQDELIGALKRMSATCENMGGSQRIAYENYLNFTCVNIQHQLVNVITDHIRAEINSKSKTIVDRVERIKQGDDNMEKLALAQSAIQFVHTIKEFVQSTKDNIPFLQDVLGPELLILRQLSDTKADEIKAIQSKMFTKRPDLGLRNVSMGISNSYINLHMNKYNRNKKCQPHIDTSETTYTEASEKDVIFEVPVSIESVKSRKGVTSIKLSAVNDKVALGSNFRFKHESSAITRKKCCSDPFGINCETVLLWCSSGYDYTYRVVIGYHHSYTFIPKSINLKFKHQDPINTDNLSVRYFGHLKKMPAKCDDGEISDFGYVFTPVATFLIEENEDSETLISSNMKYQFSPRSFIRESGSFQSMYKGDMIDDEREKVRQYIEPEIVKHFEKKGNQLISFDLSYNQKRKAFTGGVTSLEKERKYSYLLQTSRLNKKGGAKWKISRRKIMKE